VTVLVTGATGDVGRHVTARLLAGGMTVRALCRAAPDGLPHAVEVARGDVTAPQTLEPAVAGVDAIVHCAAHLGAGGRALHCRVNVGGTHALLAAAQRARVGRVVHLSTVAVYGRKGDGQLVCAADGYDPFPELRDDYAWSKIAAERWVHLYRDHGGLDAVILRPGIVYGGRRDFVARIARRGAGPLLVVLGSPGMLLPLVHVHDVAEAVLRALRTPRTSAEPLDLVGPGMPTQAEYLARWSAARRERVVPLYVPGARLLRRVAGLERVRAVRALAYRLAWATQSVRYDGGPLARALGWGPGVDLAHGLARRSGPAAVATPAASAALTLRAPATAPTVQS
jgi:nucleoside-diphosphate-sugar epimerase